MVNNVMCICTVQLDWECEYRFEFFREKRFIHLLMNNIKRKSQDRNEKGVVEMVMIAHDVNYILFIF